MVRFVAPPLRAGCRAEEAAQKLGVAAALKGRKSIAGGNAPGKRRAWEADPERVNWFWAAGNKGNSTPSGSVAHGGRFPGALPPAIKLIPCGDLNRGFDEVEMSFSAASKARCYNELAYGV